MAGRRRYVPLLYALAGAGIGLALWWSDPAAGSARWLMLLFVPALAFGGYHLAGLRANLDRAQNLPAEIQRLNQFNALVSESMTEGLILEDAAGRVAQINPALLKLLDYSAAEVTGVPWTQLVAPESRPVVAEQASLRRGNAAATYEARLLAKDGYEIPMLISSTPVQREGRYAGALSVLVNITDRRRSEAALQRVNDYLTQSLSELQQRTQEILLLNELSDHLQACRSLAEAQATAAQLLPQLFPRTAGGLYLLEEHGQAVLAAAWGGPAPAARFASADCAALQGGRPQRSRPGQAEPVCRHLAADAPGAWCVPLTGPEAALGVLCLTPAGPDDEVVQRLAQTVAHSLALALTNLQLRETLRQQSIRDVLTGLYNRRHMEETLERELRRAERQAYPVGVILLDLDHFKQVNDTFGHAAGDRLLQTVGVFLGLHIRAGDVACRFGGEEFVLILPEASLEVTLQRAEYLRAEICRLSPDYQDQRLGPVTASVGVAVYPIHAPSPTQLLRAADDALYQAKRLGRDRVVPAALPATVS